jgi:PII-like signaling protein
MSYCNLGRRNTRETTMSTEVSVVRVYLTEGETQLKTLIKRLRDWEKLRGVTIFRGISGFGSSGVIHGADLVDLSLNLPMVVEFFDTPDKIDQIWEHLNQIIKPGHMVRWNAQVNE